MNISGFPQYPSKTDGAPKSVGDPLLSSTTENAPRTSRNLSPCANSLDRYIRDIRKYPMLSAEEEKRLAQRWRRHGDQAAAHKLVTSHLRLVAKIARNNRGYKVPLDELISAGNVGLLRALKGFDPDLGCRFSTYSIWWIRASIQEYILNSWSLVKLGTTTAQKTLFFKLNRTKFEIGSANNGEMPSDWVRKVADKLNVDEAEVVQMDQRIAGLDRSLNIVCGEGSCEEYQDRLADEGRNAEACLGDQEEWALRRTLLAKSFDSLTLRERYIVTVRRLRDKPVSLNSLSQRFGVSRERIRQIELRALNKMRKSVKAAVTETQMRRLDAEGNWRVR